MSVRDTSSTEVKRDRSGRIAVFGNWWILSLASGALGRLICALFVSNSLDMRFYAIVASDAQMRKPLYADGIFSYPPLWGYILQAVGKVSLWLHVPLFVRAYPLSAFTVPGLNSIDLTTPAMSLLIKLPLVVVDVLMLLLIVDIIRRSGGSQQAAKYAAVAWWLNPIVVYCSAINASWDAIVPLTMLAAVLAAYTTRWFSAGALVAAGVLAKLTPLYAGVVVMMMALRRDERTTVMRRLVLFIAGGAAFGVFALLPVLWWHETAAMLAAIFTRTGTFVIGGPNILAFTALQPFHGVADSLQKSRGFISLSTSLLTLASVTLAAAAITRIRDAAFTDYLYALIGIVSVVLIVTPYTQPTYAVWLLPAALILSACGNPYWAKYALWLSVASSVFVLTIRSPFDLLTPLCYFSHACDAVSVAKAGLDYRSWPFPFAENFQVGVDALAGQAMCMIYIVGLIAAARHLLARGAGREAAAAPAEMGRASWRPLAYGSGAFLFVIALVLIPAPAAPLIQMHQDGRSVVVTSRGFTGVVHTVRSIGVPAISIVYVYFDNHYAQGRGVGPTFAAGFGPHLTNDILSRSLGADVRSVDAGSLASVLSGAARGVALTVMGGILPSTVRSNRVDLLQKWVARGGLVFWAGEPFDILFSQPAHGGRAPAIGAPDYSKWRRWYSRASIFPSAVDPYSPPVTHGAIRSVYWALARIAFSRTTFPCNIGPLLKIGGYPLGFVDSHVNASVSAIPFGRGRIVFFGDGFDDELVAADSVAQILATDVWSRPDRVLQEDGFLAVNRPPMTISNVAAGTHVFAFGNALPDGSPFANIVAK